MTLRDERKANKLRRGLKSVDLQVPKGPTGRGILTLAEAQIVIQESETDSWFTMTPVFHSTVLVSGKERLHSMEGRPALEFTGYDGASELWSDYGFVHRVGGPAIVLAEGGDYYIQHGFFHRVDGPAVDLPDNQFWWVYGNEVPFQNLGMEATHWEGFTCWTNQFTRSSGEWLHRIDIYGEGVWSWESISPDGVMRTQNWYRFMDMDRIDGPAVVEVVGSVHTESWYRNNLPHREDGPAVVQRDPMWDEVTERFFFEGVEYDPEEA